MAVWWYYVLGALLPQHEDGLLRYSEYMVGKVMPAVSKYVRSSSSYFSANSATYLKFHTHKK